MGSSFLKCFLLLTLLTICMGRREKTRLVCEEKDMDDDYVSERSDVWYEPGTAIISGSCYEAIKKPCDYGEL